MEVELPIETKLHPIPEIQARLDNFPNNLGLVWCTAKRAKALYRG